MCQRYLDHIDNVVNSAGDIPADEALDINVAVIKQIQGQGRKHVFSTEDLKFKGSMVEIRNNDNSCLSRAIIVGMAHLEKNLYSNTQQKSYYQKKYDRLRNNRQNNLHQEREANKLRQTVGIDPNNAGSLADIPL